jgi:hypothetical protein
VFALDNMPQSSTNGAVAQYFAIVLPGAPTPTNPPGAATENTDWAIQLVIQAALTRSKIKVAWQTVVGDPGTAIVIGNASQFVVSNIAWYASDQG